MSEVIVAKTNKPEKAVVTPGVLAPGFFSPFFRGGLFGVNPFALMRQFVEEMDKGTAFPAASAGAAWTPAIEVKQKEGKLFVTADLPGMAKEDVKVYVEGDTLVLEGERKQEKEEKREGFYHSERTYGKFYRAIALPEGANADLTAANFNNGVLEVTVPVAEVKPKARVVPVQEPPKAKAA